MPTIGTCAWTWGHLGWDRQTRRDEYGWYPKAELTFPRRFKSLRQFYEWYAGVTGNPVSRFINPPRKEFA